MILYKFTQKKHSFRSLSQSVLDFSDYSLKTYQTTKRNDFELINLNLLNLIAKRERINFLVW